MGRSQLISPASARPYWRTAISVLTFRASRQTLNSLGPKHLIFGLAFTWLAGIGRYWDNSRAELLQQLGVGSVIYVFILALLLWALLRPLGGAAVRYRSVLTFVCLTSPPALLYAIPVERFLAMKTAQQINVWFLALVATWRVALLVHYIRRGLSFSWIQTVVVTLLPLTIIVSALTALNLQHVVFRIMGGLTENEASVNDSSYFVVLVLSLLSVYAFVPLVLAYAALVILRKRNR